MKTPAIICDLDGTLALMNDRGPFEWSRVEEDSVNAVVADLLRRYVYDNVVLIVSGRSAECRNETLAWLRRFAIPFERIFMRDIGDYRKDAVIKQEIYEKHIEPEYTVMFCLDDRDQSVAFWRELGLVCFQVAPGAF
jgi:hypothetical protein